MASFLLVHSPLVGPSTWAAAATLLQARRRAVAAPDLTAMADASASHGAVYVAEAVRASESLPGEVVVVGHSGAGPFLPAIGEGLGERLALLLFVDAAIPPETGAHMAPARLQSMLDAQTRAGRLAPWLTWWPDDVQRSLVPDDRLRAALLADMPRLPRAFYDEPVAVPEGWSERRAAYLRLSEGYDSARADASRRGWPSVALDADHLAILTRAEEVVEAIIQLADEAAAS